MRIIYKICEKNGYNIGVSVMNLIETTLNSIIKM